MNRKFFNGKIVFCTIGCVLLLGGCSVRGGAKTDLADLDRGRTERQTAPEEINMLETETEKPSTALNASPQSTLEEAPVTTPEVTEADWSEYFHGLNGAAVLYDAAECRYTIFNPELARTRRSPCSTFKIISSLIALENGILDPKDSTRTWSGEVFWNEDWNRDIDFQDAFRTSCVWYFRELTDAVGQGTMQEGVSQLQYGNCDISDWQGHLNTNNNNRALTGFWIESSLLISPQEQTEVMERIFGADSIYTEATREALKQVMLVTEQDNPDVNIYGKTGMGKTGGVTVDAWFTGFAEKPAEEKTIYFCVYLGRTDNQNVTSAAAKEIAVSLLSMPQL